MNAPGFPVSLVVEGRRVLVVGGGAVAARKAAHLARCGARVRVVAPALCRSMERLVESGRVEVRRRPFRRRDVSGSSVVVAATDDAEVNRAVFEAARGTGALVNVADQPALCDFTAPSVLRRGLLTVAISTSGASPALARRLRRDLERAVGPEWSAVTRSLAEFRRRLLRRLPEDPAKRRRTLLAASEMDLPGIARSGGRPAVDRALGALIDAAAGEGRGG